MARPDADFTVALNELRQVSDTISQGAHFFESQISQGLPVARCAEVLLRTFMELFTATPLCDISKGRAA